MKCRNCQSPINLTVLDLGSHPPSNAYLSEDNIGDLENTYPLKLVACEKCWLVQTELSPPAETMFTEDYAYFSSNSQTWLQHAAAFVNMSVERFDLGPTSHVIEIACNDGYLLRNFVELGIPCLGIEPTESTAVICEKLGIPVLKEFFGFQVGRWLADNNQKADLIIGNNVFAHVPDIRDFVKGLIEVLKLEGVISLEFPHLLNLIDGCQFDTVYHEHFSYFSLTSVENILSEAGLRIFDVDEINTHGGSLRIWACNQRASFSTTVKVKNILSKELTAGICNSKFYSGFQDKVDSIASDLLEFLYDAKRNKKSVAGYGAAAKANTLLNYAGVTPDLLPVICDIGKSKQGKYMPGSKIPIVCPSILYDVPPDFLLVFPWNIAKEIKAQLSELQKSGTILLTAIPCLEVI